MRRSKDKKKLHKIQQQALRRRQRYLKRLAKIKIAKRRLKRLKQTRNKSTDIKRGIVSDETKETRETKEA